MTPRTLDHQGLLDLFSRSLRQPEARVGMRLRSERELAASLRVSRARVAWAVSKLAKQGFVARRTGSGTYLQRLPDTPSTDDATPNRVISAKHLFSGDAVPQIRQELRIRTALKIGVGWLSLGDLSRANRLTLDGMGTRAQELSHTLTIHAIGKEGAEGFDQVTRLLTRHHFDALLLCGIDFIEDRLNTISRLISRKLPPRAYFYTSDADPRCTPIVTLDASGAARHAVATLAANGYRRIAFVDLAASRIGDAYNAAMLEARLDYRATAFSTKNVSLIVNDIDVVRAGRRCAEQLLDSPSPPDALYVADDILMIGVADVLAERGITPGRDLGVISLANVGGPQPPPMPGVAWSTLIMDPARLGRQAVDLLLEVLDADDQPLANIRLESRWQPGNSHTRA